MSHEGISICGLCRRVLEEIDTPFGRGFQHAAIDAGADQDHGPIPIPMPADYAGGRCDFCCFDGPAFELPAKDVALGDGYTSAGDWAACTTCGRLIQSGNWDALAVRAATFATKRGGRVYEDVLADCKAAYVVLREAVTGPLKPITWM